MKKLVLCVIVFALLLCGCQKETVTPLPDPQDDETVDAGTLPQQSTYQAFTPDGVKAVWMSQWDLQRLYVNRGEQREEADFRVKAAVLMQNAVADGFNTVFLQVRPFGDSFYPSEVYPPAEMVVGEYGKEFVYDPLAILVDAAHDFGLSIHAWINPLRLMSEEDLQKIPSQYAIRRWYDDTSLRGQYLVLQGDGRWYLNPGYEEVRELIVEGAEEILEHYEVDGLHMDDYFYPTTSEAYDAQCFSQYVSQGGTMTLGDFRRASITRLVTDLYEAVHEKDNGALFGIAPGGNADRAYSGQYADVFDWCARTDCVDYICPEIYFGFEHESYPFDKTADQWVSIVQSDTVRLFIGLSFHKASGGFDQYAGSGAYEWAQNDDILYRSLLYVSEMTSCQGVAVFSNQYFRNALTGEVPEYPSAEREHFLPLWKSVDFSN